MKQENNQQRAGTQTSRAALSEAGTHVAAEHSSVTAAQLASEATHICPTFV